jgi:signal transduction histidine kinase
MRRELATSRRVRKGPLSSVGNGAEPRPAIPPAPTAGADGALVIRERVVADVRHEIGNYFHKLYYWADFLGDSRSGRGGDVTATQMLEETIRGFEELLRSVLEYVRPIATTPIRMSGREVLDGVVKHLRAGIDGRPMTIVGDVELGDAAVSVDPGRLSQALALLGRRLATTTPAGATIRIEVETPHTSHGRALAVAVVVPGQGAGPAARSTSTEVEWATAENIIRVLGGELGTRDDGGETVIRLVLPLQS